METAVSQYITVGPGKTQAISGYQPSNGLSGSNRTVDRRAEITLVQDRVDLSPEARETAPEGGVAPGGPLTTPSASPTGQTGLSFEQQQQLLKLAARDREVRAHEQAHLSTAGQYAAGGASFTYQLGPDGKRYAIGGEVPIDVSKGATPEETLLKMERIKAAALAPLNPSAADRQIAAQAAMAEAQARQEIVSARGEEQQVSEDVDESAAGSEADWNAQSSGASPRLNPGGVLVSAMVQAYSSMQALG